MPESGFALSTVFDAVARAVPGRELIVDGDLRATYQEENGRIDGLAHFLARQGHGLDTDRDRLRGHEAGQAMVGLYLRNGREYIEAMVASFRARAAPFNVNFRYVEEELEYLLTDAGVSVLVYHAEFAPRIAAVAPRVPTLRTLVQVADDSGNPVLPGAFDYESLLVTAPPEGGMPDPSGDDLYVAYTGGTTGLPKGVLWRQHDIYVSSMGGTPWGTTDPYTSYEAIATAAVASNGLLRLLLVTPLMHAAAQWAVFQTLTTGGTLVLPSVRDRLDARDVLATAARERALMLPVIGDAIARPLVDELERTEYDLSALAAVINSSAPLTPVLRSRLLAALPHVVVMDTVGSSETGAQMEQTSQKGAPAEPAVFRPQVDTAVLDDSLTRELAPGEGEGWLARRAYVPLGYLGDPAKTATTFPVVGGRRWSVPGDRAVVLADGRIELLGRGSLTINSGGEKIFVEEVERALAHHPAVADVLVVGRPSERWGNEPVALVQLIDEVSDEDLLAECARHVARYKVPKAVLRFERLERSPTGKADYRWARAVSAAPPYGSGLK